ncbi:MAG: Dyp-type peroxidase [Planctomycetota bacterium]
MKPQPAIFTEGSSHHYFLEFDVPPHAELSGLIRGLQEALAPVGAATAGHEPVVVVGFGDALWRRWAPSSCPDQLRAFQPIQGVGQHRAPATQHDLWFWIHGDHIDENLARALHVGRALQGAASLALEERGFTHRDSRDLTGFIDGTANPTGDERQLVALVPDGTPGAGGSFVLAQRWVHDLQAFWALPTAEQERVIGRTRPESVEFEGDAMPADSHVSRTDIEHDGVSQKLYRRSAPFGTVREQGLYFLGFACDPGRFEAILSSMFGTSGDGEHDRLIEYSKPTSGAFYFAPSQSDLEELLS